MSFRVTSIENKHSTGVKYSLPPPRVCVISPHKASHALISVRVLVLKDPPARRGRDGHRTEAARHRAHGGRAAARDRGGAGGHGAGAHGGAVQVDPITPMLKPPGAKHLKVKCEILLPTFAFNSTCAAAPRRWSGSWSAMMPMRRRGGSPHASALPGAPKTQD